MHNLIDIDKGDRSHIVFEKIRTNTNFRNIYLYVFCEKNTISFGSESNSDIKIQHSSVSKNHASLNLIDGHLYLMDNNSENPTLISLQHDMLLLLNKPFTLQFKDFKVSLILKEQNCFYSCINKFIK